MKTKFVCPECQNAFKETQSAVDFTAKCPHCSAEVSIAADPAKVEQARKIAEEKAEQERVAAEQKAELEKKVAEEKAKKEAKQAALRKQDEKDAAAIALVRYSVKRLCPHCKFENIWDLEVKPGDEAFVVRCKHDECRKSFTILTFSEDLMPSLADLNKELEVIKYRIGALVIWCIALPLLCLALFAILSNLKH